MYNLLISVGVGLVVGLLIRLTGLPLLAGIIPGLLAFGTTFVLLARRVQQKVQALATAAQKELSIQAANPREQKQRVEKAVKIFEEGLAYERWQFLIGSEIHAQIGMIKYMVKDLEGAQVNLAKANPRNPMAMAMLAALHYQKKDYARMEESFELAVKSGKKEGLVWAAYAWCLLQLKEKEKALKVMARAVEANPSDEKLKAGLTALQNDKKLKMKPYEPLWWQFGLELPTQQMGGRRVQWERR
jgi:tetratricopeptide (TPR) repeat protein